MERGVRQTRPEWQCGELLLFGRLRLFGLKAGVGPGGEFFLKPIDSASRVHVLEFTRVERVASTTDVDPKLFLSATSDKSTATTAGYNGFLITRMNAFFHRGSLLYVWASCHLACTNGARRGLWSIQSRMVGTTGAAWQGLCRRLQNFLGCESSGIAFCFTLLGFEGFPGLSGHSGFAAV